MSGEADGLGARCGAVIDILIIETDPTADPEPGTSRILAYGNIGSEL
jgi:hypothetical protein